MSDRKDRHDDDVLERNLASLMRGSDPAAPSPEARARMKARLIARHGRDLKQRSPFAIAGWGLIAAAAGAMVIANVAGRDGGAREDLPLAIAAPAPRGPEPLKLPDGSIAELGEGGKLTTLGPRRVKISGAVLLDVAPGQGVFTVETAQGELAVLGTRFLVEAQADKTTTSVLRGAVALRSGGGEEVLHAGEQGVMQQGVRPTRGPAPRLSHLVSWVAERRRADERPDRGPARSGALLARDPQWPEREFPLPIRALTVDVHLENQVARVALDQTFYNAQDQTLEGVYKFALPPGAAVSRLAMYVEGRLTESAVVERMAARRIYEDIVYQRRDPALLEQMGASKVSMRIFPLAPKQDKRVVLAYTQPLARTYDDLTMTVPLPDLETPVGEVAMQVKVVGCAACEITSASHAIEVARAGADAIVTHRATAAVLGDSLVLRVRQPAPAVTVASTIADAHRYVLLRARPTVPAAVTTAERPKRWVILDDTSASRGTTELRAQAALVDRLVDDIDERDQVMVIAFDATHRRFGPWQDAMSIDRRALQAFLARDAGLGETDLGQALAGAVQLLDGQPGYIVYVGDGTATGEKRTIDELRDALTGKRATFIGIGVGDGADLPVLSALADATAGVATSIDLGDDLAWRSLDLIASLYTNRVTGLTATIDGAGAEAIAYLRSTQVAAGEDIELLVKAPARDDVRTVTLRGDAGGQPWSQVIDVGAAARAPGDGGYLPRMWAQRRLEALVTAGDRALAPCTTTPCPSDEERAIAAYHARKGEMVALGTKHFLLSQHTSLIVLENDAMYAQYRVQKGDGVTWAPYALPSTIAVASQPAAPPAVSTAPLWRYPVPWQYGGLHGTGEGTIGLGNLGAIGHGAGGGGSGTGFGYGAGTGRAGAIATARSAGVLGGATTATPQAEVREEAKKESDASAADDLGFADADDESLSGLVAGDVAGAAPPAKVAGPTISYALTGTDRPGDTKDAARTAAPTDPAAPITTTPAPSPDPAPPPAQPVGGQGKAASRPAPMADLENERNDVIGDALARGGLRGRRGFASDRSAGALAWREQQQQRWDHHGGGLHPVAFQHSGDWRLDDLTEWLPGLMRTEYDELAEGLDAAAAGGRGSITPEAERLLSEARTKLGGGRWRFGRDAELIVDRRGRFEQRQTLDTGVEQVVSYDGSTLRYRYPQLGLAAERLVGDHEPALIASVLPLLPPRPEHLARWYHVKTSGDRTLALAPVGGGAGFTLELSPDGVVAALRRQRNGDTETVLAAVRDGSGWRATIGGEPIAVGFVADPNVELATAPADAVTIELPLAALAVARAQVAHGAGDPRWRHHQHQRAASALASATPFELAAIARELAATGPLSTAELALVSGGVRWMQLAELTAAIGGATHPVAAYLQAVHGARHQAGRGDYGALASSSDPLIATLASYRTALGAIERNDRQAAITAFRRFADTRRGDVLRIVGALRLAQQFAWQDPSAVAVLDDVATGPWRNLARAEAARLAASRGGGQAAERWIALLSDVDLAAIPPRVDWNAHHLVERSARGAVGWQLAMGAWRDRVLAGGDLAHVMAFARAAALRPDTDLDLALDRAAVLAGDDLPAILDVVQLATATGRGARAQAIVDAARARRPGSPELLRLASAAARQRGASAEAAALLGQALVAERDRPVSLAQLQADHALLIALHRETALASSGTTREEAVAAALAAGRQWRGMDPDNAARERQLGELLLAVGADDEAWRYLSSPIDRAPREGTSFQGAAEVLERQGKLEQALGLWRRAFAVDATNPTWLQRQAQVELALGRRDAAKATLRKVLDRTWHNRWDGVRWWAQDAVRSL